MSRVAGFLQHTGVGTHDVRSASRVSDPNPVRQLRLGRSPRLATAGQVPAFMEACDRTGRLRDSVLRQGDRATRQLAGRGRIHCGSSRQTRCTYGEHVGRRDLAHALPADARIGIVPQRLPPAGKRRDPEAEPIR